MADQDYIEYHCGGGVFCRQSKPEGMKTGEVIVGHRHHFTHPTFIEGGEMEISILKDTDEDAFGRPLVVEVEFTKVVKATDHINWFPVLAGKWHMLRALVDGTRYKCVYATRLPSAISERKPGVTDKPYVKRDEDGVLWYREDPKIVDTSEFVEAFR
jgi:hypothetical protein